MSILRRAARTDANQAVIVRELRDRGALVILLGQPVDLLVGYRGAWALVEVKAGPRSKIQPSQKAFLEQCQLHGVPCLLFDDLDDVDYWFPLPAPGEDTRAASESSNTEYGC